MKQNTDHELDLYIKAALGKKAMNLVALDVHDLTSFADIFIICSGRSNRQVNAKPLSVEGVGDGHWVLLDYGHVIIHVFYEPVREFYDLEGLWLDAKRIETPTFEAKI
jgi:ribosome-associated protein